MDSRPTNIDQAPSLSDILSAEERVGAVDFASHLAPGAALAAAAGESGIEKTHQHSLRGSNTAPAAPSGAMPFILPPATVGAAMAAEVARERAVEEERGRAEAAVAAVAAARAGVERFARPSHSHSRPWRRQGDEQAGSAPDAPPSTGPTSTDPADRSAAAPVGADQGDQGDRPAGEDYAGRPAGPLAAPLAGPTLEGSDDLQQVRARLPAGGDSEVDTEVAQGEIVESRALTPYRGGMGDEHGSDRSSGFVATPPPFDVSTPQTVADVADRAIAAIDAAQRAHERWLDAVHLEVTRRYELTTAQAELDAELIRIHGRRDATAFLSQARRNVGAPPHRVGDLDDLDGLDVDTTQLTEIGETFSRFAESLESALPSVETPDPYREP